MRTIAFALLALACASAAAQPAILQIGGTPYHHRYSEGALHEYTPAGQDDLDRYSDLVTLLPSPEGMTSTDLERFTAGMVDVHRSRGGDVLSRACEAAAATHAAQCTVMVMFVHSTYVEAAVARHMAMRDGIGAVSFSHREYGPDARRRVVAWIDSDAGKRGIAGFLDWTDRIGAGASGNQHESDDATAPVAP